MSSQSASQSPSPSHGSRSTNRSVSPSVSSSRPPSRAEYHSYRTLLRDIHARDTLSLSRRLHRSASSRSVSQVARTDSADVPHKRRNVEAQVELSTTWPSPHEDLAESGVSLDEAIINTIRGVIRRHRLQSEMEEVGEEVEADPDGELPLGLVLAAKVYLNRLLTNLAAMRPPAAASRRKVMRVMGRNDVLAAALIVSGSEQLAISSGKRLKRMVDEADEGTDIPALRLEIIRKARKRIADRDAELDQELYGPPIPKVDRLSKPHQSAAELEVRAEKRRIKSEKKKRKEEAKTAQSLGAAGDAQQ